MMEHAVDRSLSHRGGIGVLKQAGLTLIELMVTLTLIGVLATLAAPSFNNLIADQRLRDATSALSESLWLARSEALSRKGTVGFSFTNINAGWTVAAGATTILVQDTMPSISSGAGNYSFNAYGRLTGAGDLAVTHSGTSKTRCLSISTTGKVTAKDGSC